MSIATSASAQSAGSGGIAGSVKDASGAVIPGVTVDAASPALIEKVRTAVTDGQGNYKIVDLRPGTYTVTFTLPGFATVKREGIVLTAGFTAPANAEMKVGALEETITVTGASPVVDVQNTRTQTVLSREVLDSLPTAKTVGAFAALTLGVTSLSSPTIDVGGNKGETFLGFGVHGSRSNEGETQLEGMQMSDTTNRRRNQVNQVGVQETQLEVRGASAEQQTGGVIINVIPREGSNSLSVYAVGSASHPSLQDTNLTDEITAAGITQLGGIKYLYDMGAGMGGPIRRNRIWFYTAHDKSGTAEYHPGFYFNKNPGAFFYEADLSRQKYNTYDVRDHSGRITMQLSQKNKVAFSTSFQWNCTCYKLSGGVDVNRSPEATGNTYFEPQQVTSVTWQHPRTNRLLLDLGVTYNADNGKSRRPDIYVPGTIAKHDLDTGFKWGDNLEGITTIGGNDYGNNHLGRVTARASMAYVTGSHNFKTGINIKRLKQSATTLDYWLPTPYSIQLRNRVPTQITQWAAPNATGSYDLQLGYFAQDQWTIRRLTVNAGFRIDTLAGSVPSITLPAGPYRPPVVQPADDAGTYAKDIVPRMGAAYDVFGNGKTAVKVSLGRFTGGGAAGAQGSSITTSTTRPWNDSFYPVGDARRGNLKPDCDLTNVALNGECGPINNLNFGKPTVSTTITDFDELRGWQKRGYSWQMTTALQQQLRDNVGLQFGYYRTWYGNFGATDNLLVTPADYTHFCVTAPADSRLPGGGGNQLCGLYDLNPNKRGLSQTFRTSAKKLGVDQSEVYNGFDANLSTRFGGGKLLQGGMSIGRTVTDNCSIVDSPQQAREGFCHVSQPWSSTLQIKIAGVYPLPGGLQLSGTLQNISTFAIGATRTYVSSEVQASLGRPLTSGNAAIPLIAPNTEFADRHNQLDLRLTKIFKPAGKRIQANVDLYNALNAGTVINSNSTYGATWLRPLTIIGARTVKFGAQLDW